MFIDNFENQSKEIQSESLKKQWLKTATEFLKGKPYQDLEWEFSEGISIEPYYTKDDTKNEGNNSDFSYLQILQNNQLALNEPISQPRFWYNQPFVKVNSLEKEELEKVNKETRQILMSGAEGVLFDLRNIELNDFDKKIFENLLFEIALSYCAVSFQIELKDEKELQNFFEKYSEYVKEKGFEMNLLTGGILYSNLISQLDKHIDFSKVIESKTNFRFISLEVNNGKDKNIDEAQNIAETLFQVKNLVEKTNKQILQNIQFVVKANDSFFVTIAKIRALRWLLIQMYDLYEVDYKPYIHSLTSQGTDEKSLQDENWNLIRNTTQAFSCILGGTDALTVVSHQNQESGKNTIWANRIARNVSIMLCEESFIDKNADPISGSYYCEQMSDKLITSAWEKFQKMIN